MRPRATDIDTVVDAATQCFAQRGFAQTTVDDVAAEAGVSRATVYRYVGGKQLLQRVVVGREAAKVAEALGAVASQATSPTDLVALLAATAAREVPRSAVLERAMGEDLPTVLPDLTIEAVGWISACTAMVVALLRSPQVLGGALSHAGDDLAALAEEMVRFEVQRFTTPSIGGVSREPEAVGRRAALVFGPALEALAHGSATTSGAFVGLAVS